MSAFLAAVQAEIATLEAELAADPRHRRLALLRQLSAMYEDVAPTAAGQPATPRGVPADPAARAERSRRSRGVWTPEMRAAQAERNQRAAGRLGSRNLRSSPTPEAPAIEPEIELYTGFAGGSTGAAAIAAPRRCETLYDAINFRRVSGDRVEELPGRRFRVNGGPEIDLAEFVRRAGTLRGRDFDLPAIMAMLPEHVPAQAEALG